MREKITIDHFRRILKENPIIYQYSSIDGAKELLNQMTLMIKNPTIVNDPHDCDIRLLNFESANKENLKERIEKFNNYSNPGYIDYDNLTEEKIKEAYEKMSLPKILETIGIVCFSKNFNSSLMWSHYTYSHKGICIGFDLMKLYTILTSFHDQDLSLVEVDYKNEFEPIDFFNQDSDAIYHWIRTKSSIWEYEEEIRLLFTNLKFTDQKKILLEFHKSAIKEIILGNRIDPENEEWLKNFCKKNLDHIELYKMEKIDKSFDLKPIKTTF